MFRFIERVRTIHQESRGTYGAPRVHAELALGQRIRCSRKRIARLMRLAGLVGVHRRRLRGCTRRDERQEPRPDLVRRDFTASGPNRLWVADLTQHMTGEGWLYLATVLDVFSRRVVGWAMGARAEAELVLSALNMAVWRGRFGQRGGRKLLRHPANGTAGRRPLGDKTVSHDGDLQLHRGFLQPEEATFDPGIPEPKGL